MTFATPTQLVCTIICIYDGISNLDCTGWLWCGRGGEEGGDGNRNHYHSGLESVF